MDGLFPTLIAALLADSIGLPVCRSMPVAQVTRVKGFADKSLPVARSST